MRPTSRQRGGERGGERSRSRAQRVLRPVGLFAPSRKWLTTLLPKWTDDDLYRQRQLHQVQIHRLRRGMPGRLRLPGREHAHLHPDECIDCGVCEPECPVDAIKPDTESGLEKWLVLNREYAEKWPNITAKKPGPPDADAYRDEKGISIGTFRPSRVKASAPVWQHSSRLAPK